ncbi:phosphoadenosine phosphosulfate reductase domain-containing protein [Thermococcus barophilus]|uniref:3'-phosphoadenosine 5'-phosphosulfate sulfotransferase n=1 Tax=Thermococcus barophilus TaxID=55802 RepID=A0A0S1XCW5_THEBA|nr:phosphoadenosine phosphosulfate reductase family protein [Thermococcus barophilus]ALM75628.1 3'-phosphoadenosine 5'-phosphosulfate sulfotransferase [Thermococcus barophilus]
MFHVIVRARKDAKALQYINKRNYGGFLKVSSLGGRRRFKEVEDILEELKEHSYIPILLFGEKERELAKDITAYFFELGKPFYSRILRTKKVRNMRVDELYAHLEEIKARFRLGIEWNGTYKLNPENPLGIEINPDYDIYLAFGDRFGENMREILGIDIGSVSLVLRKLMNQEVYYSGSIKIAEVSKRIGEETEVLWKIPYTEEISLEDIIKANESYIRAFEKASESFLKQFEGYDIIVPWSGGKDSTAALILASKVFRDVTAVYVKMEYEMPQTDEYVEKLAKKLKVNIIESFVKMPVDKYGFPTHNNRWCTRMKVEALYNAIKEFDSPVLVIGDRDGESAKRRLKPPAIERKNEVLGTFLEVMPIKFWSGMMVQLYILMNGFDLHPLYYEGFYRLGCTICPSLADWEITLLKKRGEKNLPPH